MDLTRRPPCALFSVKEITEREVEAIKRLSDAGYEVIMVGEEHFETALRCIERVRKPVLDPATKTRATVKLKPV